MTNREQYQRTFSVLRPSRAWTMEEPNMKSTRKHFLPRAVLVCAVVVLALALAAGAYAADLGGIQRTIQIWTHGDETDAVLNIENSQYTLTYEDAEGEPHEVSGGGKAFDAFGRERNLTEAEILEHLDMPEVEYAEDGTVWVFYHSQKIEITDRFDDDGVCYVQVREGDQTLYLTVKYQNGHSVSTQKFPNPKLFN